MRARLLKQIGYGVGCSTVAILFIALISTAVINNQPDQAPTPTVVVDPITVEQIDSIRHEDSIDIVVRLRSSAPRRGTGSYPLTFILRGENNEEISRHQEVTYVLPGVKYVAVVALPVTQAVAKVEVVLPANADFVDIPDKVALPSFTYFPRERITRVINQKPFEEQKGIVRNTSTLDWERVEVAGVALDRSGKIVGIGKTFVGQLKAGEQREFTMQWPAPLTPTDQVVVLPTTNMFQQDNIIRAIGDPASLR